MIIALLILFWKRGLGVHTFYGNPVALCGISTAIFHDGRVCQSAVDEWTIGITLVAMATSTAQLLSAEVVHTFYGNPVALRGICSTTIIIYDTYLGLRQRYLLSVAYVAA